MNDIETTPTVSFANTTKNLEQNLGLTSTFLTSVEEA